MTAWASSLLLALQGRADTDTARAMRAYMRDQFPFLGIKTPLRRQISRPFMLAAKQFDESMLLAAADWLWSQPQRECQYVVVDLVAQSVSRLGSSAMTQLEQWVQTKSWWDTVDGLAAWVMGPLVLADRTLQTRMDELSTHENLWLRRAALLHQLHWKRQTDTARLFAYCQRNASDPEFFIRKAIGWALREFAYTDPDAVRDFVEHTSLSPLSAREAMKHLMKEPP
ncbi:3-methyladenine DNA glycosylase AlkD [Chitinivorax tropicus]|uniref:3-methyladenine DNA glycosylase AlkD n=1 Tax=Chitinivorax tropicus TaxID=714531 RepID=A0A840MEG9_9PROT|nr:DNA alkylation repair protein [Chitinivorax tropicus]MBB5017078.1 3-methyladenine DNA glycosylase AlkD [Chitinivorax tropicus]